MSLALRFSCDVIGCGSAVLIVKSFENPTFGAGLNCGVYSGVDDAGWIDGDYQLPEGWKVHESARHGSRFFCPVHAKESDAG